VEWSPPRLAQPVDWELRYLAHVTPIGVVRCLVFNNRAICRAVTLATRSDNQQSIGFYATSDEAIAAICSHFLAQTRALHDVAANSHGSPERHEPSSGHPQTPP
jgi:hypothetical protein